MKISNNIKPQGGVTDDTSLCGKLNGHLLEILVNIDINMGLLQSLKINCGNCNCCLKSGYEFPVMVIIATRSFP